jgi:hypothetical protein
MLTSLFEIAVYINNKQLNVLNTQMNISVIWDIELEKKENSASLKYIFESVYGNFTIEDVKDSYKKTSTYTFKTNEEWIIQHVPYPSDNISPTSAVINFDDKTIKIKL